MSSQTLPTTNPGNSAKALSIGLWTMPHYALLDDSLYASINYTLSSTPAFYVALVKGGTKGTTEYDGAPAYPEANTVIGSSTSMWGLTLSPSDINASNFGCAIYVYYDVKTGTDKWSDYLWCDKFGFTIPANRTIAGVEVTIKNYENWTRPDIFVHYINYVTMTVYYSDLTAGSVTGLQDADLLYQIGFS